MAMPNFHNAAVMRGPGTLSAPPLAPVIEDFDPTVEQLAFTLGPEDADSRLVLRDLVDGSGVRVEVNGRLMATLMGCAADDIPETCLTFEFED